MNSRDSFQDREHLDLIWAMKIMGVDNIDERGMCYGFDAAAVDFFYSDKLTEYDELINLLLHCIRTTHVALADQFTPEAFETHLKQLLEKENNRLMNEGKTSITDLFTMVSKLHLLQQTENPYSNATISKNDLVSLPEIVGIYDINDLGDYFSSLWQIIDQPSFATNLPGLALLMNSMEHSIMIVIKPNTTQLLFRDINHPKKKNITIEFLDDFEPIMSALLLSNPQAKYVFCITNIFIPKKNQEILLPYIQAWQEMDAYKTIHDITLKQLTRISGDKGSLLLHAVIKNNLESVKKMVTQYGNIEMLELQFQTMLTKALCFAIMLQYKDIVNFLLSKNINLNLPVISNVHKFDIVALNCAIEIGDTDTAKIILSHNVDINLSSSMMLSDLFNYANKMNRGEEFKKFIYAKYKIDITLAENNTMQMTGCSALHLAAWMGQEDIVTLLLNKNASIIMINCDSISPDELAQVMGHEQIAELIREKYKETMQAELMQLEDPADAMHTSVLHYLQALLKGKISLVEYNNVQLLFKELNRLKQTIKNNPLLTVVLWEKQLNQFYERYPEITKNKNYSDIDDEIAILKDKLHLLNKATHITHCDNAPELSALRHLEFLICNTTSIRECGIACNAFEALINMRHKLTMQKKSRFSSNSVHIEWEQLVQNFYSYFTTKTDFDYVELHKKIKIFNEQFKKNPFILALPISKLSAASLLTHFSMDETTTLQQKKT